MKGLDKHITESFQLNEEWEKAFSQDEKTLISYASKRAMVSLKLVSLSEVEKLNRIIKKHKLYPTDMKSSGGHVKGSVRAMFLGSDERRGIVACCVGGNVFVDIVTKEIFEIPKHNGSQGGFFFGPKDLRGILSKYKS